MSFADEALTDGEPDMDKIYLNASIVPPTSVKVESLFSESGYIFDERRLATTPERIEQLMFLKTNRFLWDLEFVAQHVVNGELALQIQDEDEVEVVAQ